MLTQTRHGLLLIVAIVATMFLMFLLGSLTQFDQGAAIYVEQQRGSANERQSATEHSGSSRVDSNERAAGVANEGGKLSPETYVSIDGYVLKLSDGLIIVLTFFIAAFTGCLFLEEKDKSRKELRAYLGIPDPVVQRLGIRNHFQVQVNVTNTGKTPAKRVQRWMRCKLMDGNGPAFNFPSEPFDAAMRSVAPDSQWHLREDFTDWTDDDLNDITGYRKTLYVWGQVRYWDIHGNEHNTPFRLRSYAHRFEFRIGANPDGPGAVAQLVTLGWTLEPESEGNDFD